MICQKCGVREGTEVWCESGSIGYVHGLSTQRCRRCVVEAQRDHARKMADLLPALEQELARIDEREPGR